MIKLLSANFYRLFRSKAFWGIFVVAAGLSLYPTIINDRYMSENGADLCDPFWTFGDISFMGFLLSALLGLVIGDEFSSGAVRNKLLSGIPRKMIYLSYFIVSFIGMTIIHIFSVMLPLIIIPLKYDCSFDDVGEFLMYVLFSIVPLASQTAILLLILCLIRKKAMGTAGLFGVSLLMMILAMSIAPQLEAAEISPLKELQSSAFIERILPEGYFNEIFLVKIYVDDEIFQMLPPPVTCGILGVIALTAGMLIFEKIDLN